MVLANPMYIYTVLSNPVFVLRRNVSLPFMSPFAAPFFFKPQYSEFLLVFVSNGRKEIYSVCIVRWRWNFLQGQNTTANSHGPHNFQRGGGGVND